MVTAIVIKNSPIQGAQRELPWQAPFISSYCFIIIKALDLLTLKKNKICNIGMLKITFLFQKDCLPYMMLSGVTQNSLCGTV